MEEKREPGVSGTSKGSNPGGNGLSVTDTAETTVPQEEPIPHELPRDISSEYDVILVDIDGKSVPVIPVSSLGRMSKKEDIEENEEENAPFLSQTSGQPSHDDTSESHEQTQIQRLRVTLECPLEWSFYSNYDFEWKSSIRHTVAYWCGVVASMLAFVTTILIAHMWDFNRRKSSRVTSFVCVLFALMVSCVALVLFVIKRMRRFSHYPYLLSFVLSLVAMSVWYSDIPTCGGHKVRHSNKMTQSGCKSTRGSLMFFLPFVMILYALAFICGHVCKAVIVKKPQRYALVNVDA